jgi:hypothetical protein
MTASILPVGAFVWCRFPLRERHRDPGPNDHLHLVYVVDTSDVNAVTIYTTTTTWDPNIPVPLGVIVIPKQQAAALGQKAFVLDARRIGILPITLEWFPNLNSDGHGVVKIASKPFQDNVARIAREVASRHRENIELYGPGAPELRPESTRKP